MRQTDDSFVVVGLNWNSPVGNLSIVDPAGTLDECDSPAELFESAVTLKMVINIKFYFVSHLHVFKFLNYFVSVVVSGKSF